MKKRCEHFDVGKMTFYHCPKQLTTKWNVCRRLNFTVSRPPSSQQNPILNIYYTMNLLFAVRFHRKNGILP
jgi:hypothetical protein